MTSLEKPDQLSVEEANLSFNQLISEAPEALVGSLQSASVVILPSRDEKDVFFAGTLDTLDYLNENGLDTDLYATDDDYKELSLHGADIWFGTFLVKEIVLPIFCSVVAGYILTKLSTQKDDRVSLKIIVEKRDGSSTAVSYDGKIGGLEKAISEVKRLGDESETDNS